MAETKKTRKPRRAAPPPAANKQDIPARVGRQIRNQREEHNLLLEQCAAKAKMSTGALSEIENGKRWRARFFDLYALAKAIGCKVSDFFPDD